MNLEFTKAAVGDLKSIRQYTLEIWGGGQEEVYLNDLWKKFEHILDDPSRWRFRNDLFPGCQVASQGRHVILFRVQGKTLQIVRITPQRNGFSEPPEGKRITLIRLGQALASVTDLSDRGWSW